MEQEQEQEGTLGVRIGALVLALLPACGGGTASTESDPVTAGPIQASATETQLLWAGGPADGPFVLVEPLSPPSRVDTVAPQEEALYRQAFGIPESMALLRVQVMQDVPGEGLGEILANGVVFHSFAEPPEDLEPNARLYWHAVSRGGQGFVTAKDSLQRTSYIVAAETTAPSDSMPLQWRRGDLTIDLTARTWNGRQRRSFLEAPDTFQDE